MPSASDSVYPRLKNNPSSKELHEVYTPTPSELAFARERTRQPVQRVGLLLLLKTFQRLGYFVRYAEIPTPIVRHVSNCAGFPEVPEPMEAYDAGTARDRHTALVREFLGVIAYGQAARQVIIETCLLGSRTRDDLPDIINMAIEELIRQRYELPAFSTLLRIARAARNTVNRDYQMRVCASLNDAAKQRLLALLTRPEGESRSIWDQVKCEPKRSTVPQLRNFLDHLCWLQQQNVAASAFIDIPEAKIWQFAAEARSLDLASMNDLPERKRFTLAAALILKQVARALDDVADMFIRQIRKMHNKAHEALTLYRTSHAENTDALIAKLRDIALAYKTEGSREQRMRAIESLLEKDADQILAECAVHGAMTANHHLSFLPEFYSGRRSTLFLFLESVTLISTTQDQALSEAIAFMRVQRGARGDWLKIPMPPDNLEESANPTARLDLSFISDKWWPVVTGNKDQSLSVFRVNRRYFELCVFTEVMFALKSGDLCIPGSNQFSDYRKELVSEEEYQQGLALYGEQAGIPVAGAPFIQRLREQLEAAAKTVDDGFPDNEYLQIEQGEPVLKRLRRKPEPAGRRKLEQLLADRMTEVGIVDVLSDTEHWLNWTRHFGPISGHDTKLDNPRERYFITTFCYGCDLGPTQIARSINGLDRRQVSFINQRHVTEETLNQAITTVIRACRRNR